MTAHDLISEYAYTLFDDGQKDKLCQELKRLFPGDYTIEAKDEARKISVILTFDDPLEEMVWKIKYGYN